MMNKLKSARVNSLRFLFILPVLAVIILSFRKELKNSFTGRQSLPIKASASVRDTVPDAPLPPPPPEPKKLPNDVERISISNNIATVVLKNGSKEVYNLQKPVDKKSFEKKYGSVVPPVPPPPPAPASPVSVTENAPVAVAGVETVSVTDAPVAVAGYAVAPSPVTVTVAGVAMPTTGVVTKTIPGVSVASGHLAVTEASGDFITGDEAIIITITKNTTRQELDAFVKQMKEKGVEMTYDEIKYNNDGVLVNISGDLRSKTGHSNFVGQGFSKLVLALMKKGEKTWFRVIVTDGKAEI